MGETNLVFYGVRGSYPVPHKNTNKYGGNTASILIEKDDHILILDGGTGIINIGNYIKARKPQVKYVDLFLTHLHSDHIQGIPFFEPDFDKEFHVAIYCDNNESNGISFQETIYSLFDKPLSPVGKKGIKAKFTFVELDTRDPKRFSIAENFTLDYIKENDHPLSGVIIYRVNVEDKQVVYATDVETPHGFDGKYLEFIKGADILIHDSQYFDADYYAARNPKIGFGHSTVSMAAANAVKAGVKKLFLFHYSPDYMDKDVERMLAEARKTFKNTYLSEELKKINLRR
ncbi:MAG: MBL fold metallo-hydrolase [Candidatus Aminicenantes bacterium]|nr:MBL fold metallo-hydrolase [Candidatus Aminicenantes bacterium]